MTARSEFHKSPTAWLREGIDAIARDHQDLSAVGWRTISGRNSGDGFERYRAEMALPNFDEMVFDALLGLAGRRIPANCSSYGFRNALSHEVGRYINNGALIVAAILAGYESVRKTGEVNCLFRRPRNSGLHPALRGGDHDRGWST